MFTTIMSVLSSGLLPKMMNIFERLEQGKITAEQARMEYETALAESVADVQKAWAAAYAEAYPALMRAAAQSKVIAVAWAITLISQLFVLFWYQWVVPFWTWYAGPTFKYPSAGTTVEWAYALILALIGAGYYASGGQEAISTLKQKLLGR